MVIGTKKKKKKEPPIENLKKGLARSGKIVLDALGPLGQTSDLHRHQYPCYVIALNKLLKMDKLEPHDDLLDKGMPACPGSGLLVVPQLLETQGLGFGLLCAL